jgi:hypothetical protein
MLEMQRVLLVGGERCLDEYLEELEGRLKTK